MEYKRAVELVSKTLGQPFDRTEFNKLANQILKTAETKDSTTSNAQVKDKFKEYINHYHRHYKYTDADGKVIDVIEVHLKKDALLERARTLLRNFVSAYMKTRGKEAALVAFISPDQKQWRFSLIILQNEIELLAEGGIKGKEKITPAKRYSFLVGEGENTHTAQRQLAKLLENEKPPTLAQLEEAFSVNKVEKDFFTQYKGLFENLVKTLLAFINTDENTKQEFIRCGIYSETPEKSKIDDFAKRLLGQIVFLYFVQKKGWLGVTDKWGDGDRHFLRTQFSKAIAQGKNYFNDVLEHLFYDALAKDHSDEDHYHSSFDCKIPFLNGGLFEPIFAYEWRKTDINLTNELFSNEIETKEGDKGTGILDVFDRYNFTVAEDEPLEKEVAIDPEMLGKVFENLLPENLRKGKGAFYTPREIVHYMCQESLISYLFGKFDGNIKRQDFEDIVKHSDLIYEHDLEAKKVEQEGRKSETYEYYASEAIRSHASKIDKLLRDIKVCDPAIGSGAFPVGMMIEIVKARKLMACYIGKEPKIYQYKRHAIQESIYGVDIDAGAIEIAKLRLWLSLIVDEDDINKIEPLPNLDYKIMQGNSLLEEYEGIKLFEDSLLKSRDNTNRRKKQLQAELEQLHTTYKIMADSAYAISTAQKKALQNEIENKKKQIKTLDEIKGTDEGLLFAGKSRAVDMTEQLHTLHTNYFNATSRQKKSDIKEQIDKLQWELIEQTLKEQKKLDKLQEIKKLKIDGNDKFFLWKLNFAEVFEQGGFDVVIGNPPYIKEYTDKSVFDGTRTSPYYQGKMDLWYFFGAIGLDILAPKGLQCFIAPNNWVTNAGASKLRDKIVAESQIVKFIDFGNFKVFDTAGIQTMVYLLCKSVDNTEYKIDYRKLLNDKVDNSFLVTFLQSQEDLPDYQFYIVDFDRRDFADSYINFLPEKLSILLNKISKQDNVFYLQENQVAQGIVAPQDFVSNSHVKDFPKLKVGQGIFNLSDSEKNQIAWNDKELEVIKPFYTTSELGRYSGNPENSLWVIYADSQMNKEISNYPNIKRHLDKFSEVITSDFKPYGLHRARNQKFFEGEKIISLRKCHEPTFTYTDFDCYVSQTFFVIKPENINMLFLTGLLNSTLVKFWLKLKGKVQGNLYQVDKEPLLNIPLIKANAEQVDMIANGVAKIIISQKGKSEVNIDALKDKIDELVYELYDLTEAEKKLIEASV